MLTVASLNREKTLRRYAEEHYDASKSNNFTLALITYVFVFLYIPFAHAIHVKHRTRV